MHTKKTTRKKGKKHRTASEEGKSRNIDNVLTFIRFSPLRSKKSQPYGGFMYRFIKAQQILKKANLDRAFGESRSGMIAHKKQKRITAGTH
jgi:hypothetical protein